LSRNAGDVPPLEGVEAIFGFLAPQGVKRLTSRGIETGKEMFNQLDPFGRWEG
jgi:hypothetical protein